MTAPSASSLLERATQQLDLKNTAEAERICREALRLDPWLADAHLQLATVLQAADRKTEAIAALTTMTKALPQDVRGYRRLGAAHQDMQGYGAATAAYLQAVKLPGADHDDLKRLAACQSLAGLTVDAAQTLTALTRLEPDAAEHPYNLSQLMTKLGNADAARTAIRKACQLL
ncbi:MAG: tetratricopeptide repeat protein, partial [Rhodospirillaceae bacterium]|nr:tetratricopeptide repeat protein [Rhodospirillaceae bacterium]